MTHNSASHIKDRLSFPFEIEPLSDARIPDISKPETYNDDLYMTCVQPDRATWAGEQTKSDVFNIPGAISHAGHVRQAMRQPFHLASPTPIPEDLTRALSFASDTPGGTIRRFWTRQVKALKQLVRSARPIQGGGTRRRRHW